MASTIANWAHKSFILGSLGFATYLGATLSYNFYLNWNTTVDMSEDHITEIGIGKMHKIDQKKVKEVLEQNEEQRSSDQAKQQE